MLRFIATKVVLDSETFEVQGRDGYWYDGPVDSCTAPAVNAVTPVFNLWHLAVRSIFTKRAAMMRLMAQTTASYRRISSDDGTLGGGPPPPPAPVAPTILTLCGVGQ